VQSQQQLKLAQLLQVQLILVESLELLLLLSAQLQSRASVRPLQVRMRM